MLIEWAQTADSDLSEIFAYFLALDEEEKAKHIISRLIKTANTLSQYPLLLGRIGRMEGTREVVVKKLPYILVYRIIPESVKILRVIHTSREFPDSLEEETEENNSDY